MRHLVRAGALLILVLLVLLVGLRMVPVPELLVDFGFHSRNSVENEKLWASLPIQYASFSTCVNCHEEKYNLWMTGGHKVVSCENCHGPTSEHLETGKPPVVVGETKSLCSLCHAKLVSRPSSFPQVDIVKMAGDKDCQACHDPHEPRAGEPPLVPHTLEGRTECQSCHNPREPLVEIPHLIPHTLEGRSDCLSCHGSADFRGATLPRIPHSLKGREDCLVCHGSGRIRPLPEDHAGRKSTTCLNCHRSEEAEK